MISMHLKVRPEVPVVVPVVLEKVLSERLQYYFLFYIYYQNVRDNQKLCCNSAELLIF